MEQSNAPINQPEMLKNLAEPVLEAEKDQQEATQTPLIQTKTGQGSTELLIPINDRGRVVARNQSELMRYCKAMSLSGAVPDRFDTVQKLFGALMFARDLGLPDTAIRQIANIKGTPAIFGDLPLALVQRSGQLNYFREVWFDKDYNEIKYENKNLHCEAWGSVTFIRRSGAEEIRSYAFTLDDARAAGMLPGRNKDVPWEKYPKQMLRYKARNLGLKSEFADYINGVAIAESDFDILGTENMRDVTPDNTALALSNALKEEKND